MIPPTLDIAVSIAGYPAGTGARDGSILPYLRFEPYLNKGLSLLLQCSYSQESGQWHAETAREYLRLHAHVLNQTEAIGYQSSRLRDLAQSCESALQSAERALCWNYKLEKPGRTVQRNIAFALLHEQPKGKQHVDVALIFSEGLSASQYKPRAKASQSLKALKPSGDNWQGTWWQLRGKAHTASLRPGDALIIGTQSVGELEKDFMENQLHRHEWHVSTQVLANTFAHRAYLRASERQCVDGLHCETNAMVLVARVP